MKLVPLESENEVKYFEANNWGKGKWPKRADNLM